MQLNFCNNVLLQKEIFQDMKKNDQETWCFIIQYRYEVVTRIAFIQVYVRSMKIIKLFFDENHIF